MSNKQLEILPTPNLKRLPTIILLFSGLFFISFLLLNHEKSFIHLRKKFGICFEIRIRYPGSGCADPDPHRNEADPKQF